MNGETCFFIGNKDVPSNIRAILVDAVENHINLYNVTKFIVGHYGSFDSMVIGVLRDIKKRYNEIELYLLCPYALNQRIEVLEDFKGILYPEGLEFVPRRYAIVQANKYMVQNSDYLITYCHHIGNTRNIVKYAQKREEKGLLKITFL